MWHKISGVFTAGKPRDPKRFGAIGGGKFQTGSVSPSTATAAAQRNAERLELMYGRNGKMMKNWGFWGCSCDPCRSVGRVESSVPFRKLSKESNSPASWFKNPPARWTTWTTELQAVCFFLTLSSDKIYLRFTYPWMQEMAIFHTF